MDYFLWKADSALFSKGSFHLYWYAMVLILSYLVSVIWIRKKFNLHTGMKAELFVIISFLLSFSFARIGFSLSFGGLISGGWISNALPFYIKNGIQFIGLDKLILPTGLIGLLASIWLGKKLILKNWSFLKTLDFTIPLISIISALFFLGNFFHHDIIGKPTDSGDGVVHIGPIMSGLKELKCCIMRNPDGPNPLKQIEAKKGDSSQGKGVGYKKITLTAVFMPEIAERNATEFIIGDMKTYLFEHPKFIFEPGTEPIKHALTKLPEGNISATITTIGIARYPVRFYLFIFCGCLFLISYFFLNRINLPPGASAGILILLFSLVYFLLEFITEHSELDKQIQGLYLNQWGIIPSMIISIALISISTVKNQKKPS